MRPANPALVVGSSSKCRCEETGGGGWGHFKVSAGPFSDSAWLSGWTAGAGIEYAFMPNWSAKVEYLHYGFGSETFFGALSSGNLDVNTIKAGINYRF
jgi:outer membrane immunogenic protein